MHGRSITICSHTNRVSIVLRVERTSTIVMFPVVSSIYSPLCGELIPILKIECSRVSCAFVPIKGAHGAIVCIAGDIIGTCDP